MRKYGGFKLYLLMDIYLLFIKQSRTDFNKGLSFDSLNNAYILAYPDVTIQLNSIISCSKNSDHSQYFIINSAILLRACKTIDL